MCKVISVANQKGGVSKTTTSINLGVGLAKAGKKALLIDSDGQGSMTAGLGYSQPDMIDVTLSTVMATLIEDGEIENETGILHHAEGVDLLPANIELSGLEVSLVNIMSREHILRQYVQKVRDGYDYIIIDCMPSLGILTINALTAADSVIIPVQAAYLPVKGLEQLIQTIGKIRRQLNPGLYIEGILLTMIDRRTNFGKDIITLIERSYGDRLRIFDTRIPFSVRAAEASAEGISIYQHDPKGKVSVAYSDFTSEVLANEEK